MASLSEVKFFYRSSKYLVKNLFNLFSLFRKEKLIKLVPFKFLTWHHGFLYFKAENNKKEQLFIKIDTKVFCVMNEVKACHILNDNHIDEIPEIVNYYKFKRADVVVFKNIVGESLSKEILESKPHLVGDMYRLIERVSNAGLCHRDIKLDNFILSDKLIIIDFTYFSQLRHLSEVSTCIETPKDIEIVLGNPLSREPLSWNDFSSLYYLSQSLLEGNIVNPQLRNELIRINRLCIVPMVKSEFTYTSKNKC
ncbi:hypothetical protein FCV59_20545 [Vibrio sp. F13]|uniref:hypothetical protein n=1 Tax=Vibrio sp. F13 TaxID=2070777 RepID=UPI0010BD4ED9|nr:hypothetical protein [Vibrio sp. F13]TKF69493.1 hypothetical protein FCV59_20545 [Vibrio sp. F13]